jgi:hypothetical protein
MEEHNIPDDAKLMSDSGWECGAANMNGIYYNRDENVVVFRQRPSKYDKYFENPDWKLLYGELPDWERD